MATPLAGVLYDGGWYRGTCPVAQSSLFPARGLATVMFLMFRVFSTTCYLSVNCVTSFSVSSFNFMSSE